MDENCRRHLDGPAPFALAFNFSTVASVCSGRARASFTQPLQHRKTGRPFTMTFTGTPIEPRLLSGRTGQYCWDSASRRSSGLSLASDVVILSCSSRVIDGRTVVAVERESPDLPVPLAPK